MSREAPASIPAAGSSDELTSQQPTPPCLLHAHQTQGPAAEQQRISPLVSSPVRAGLGLGQE